VAAICVLVVVGVVARLVPHMPNFGPVTATGLFCGVYMSRRTSIGVVLAVMLLSDYALLYVNPYGSAGFGHAYEPWALWHSSLPYVYASYGISTMVGWLVRGERSGALLACATLFCSLQFFLITNAAVWLEGSYARGIDGLWQSYVAGLPFFRGTLLGDACYVAVFFGAYELVKFSRSRSILIPSLKREPDPA
jgi:hypothetical protein